MTISVALIWVQSADGVIGQGGTMPWHLPEDLAHFKELTLGSPVIMGRKTWDSLPERFRPLPGRRNIVVTRQTSFSAEGAEVVHSVAAAHDHARSSLAAGETVWVIGGADIFAEAIGSADRLEITQIRETFDGDTCAPEWDESWVLTTSDPQQDWHTSSSGLHYRFERYEKRGSIQR